MKILLPLITLLLLPGAANAELKAATRAQITDVQRGIDAAGARWTAGETPVSGVEDDGYLGGLSTDIPEGPLLPELSEKSLPESVDWRSHSGNFVTVPKDQARCGSCWAFAMTGALESYVLRTRHMAGANLDLSEQVMLSCSGAGSCSGGRLSASFLEERGLPPENFYPYAAANVSCSAAQAGWGAHAFKAADSGIIVGGSASRLKAAVAAHGPIVTSMLVYEDFKHYRSGVYERVSGSYKGAHAVLLVGYNDEEEYFIVKNSWGTGWGEGGYFRIAYSEMRSRVFFGGLYSVALYDSGKSLGAELPARVYRQAETLLR